MSVLVLLLPCVIWTSWDSGISVLLLTKMTKLMSQVIKLSLRTVYFYINLFVMVLLALRYLRLDSEAGIHTLMRPWHCPFFYNLEALHQWIFLHLLRQKYIDRLVRLRGWQSRCLWSGTVLPDTCPNLWTICVLTPWSTCVTDQVMDKGILHISAKWR